MKNTKFLGLIAIAAVIGFSFIACDDGSGDGGSGGGEGGKTLTSITAVYTPTTVIFTDTTIATLKEGLTVTAHYSDSTNAPVTAYTLSIEGEEFTVGENTVTVTYSEGGVTKTTTFKVTVDALDHVHNWQLKEEKTAPTCTGEGEGLYECTLGEKGAHTDDLPIAALGHDWNDTLTILPATETTNSIKAITCKHDPSHTKDETAMNSSETGFEYATGTAGLDFALITTGTNANTYRVSNKDAGNGTATGAIFIPAYHRPNTSSAYLPVTEINNGTTNSNASNAFGGTGSGANANTTITSITFAQESQLTTISAYAFYYCTSLTSITIPASVQTIGQQAFNSCTSLTSINIPANVTSIGQEAFYGCTGLASINVDAANTSFASQDGILYNKAKTTLRQAPEGISGSITIPAGVTSIDSSAFNRCSSLASVTFEAGSQLTSIGTNAFFNCTSLTSITIPDSVTTIGDRAFMSCTSLTGITIPAGVTTIGQQAFNSCTSLTSINISASVTSIGTNAFQSCTSLTSINVDANNLNYASQDGIVYNKAKTSIVAIPRGISGSITIPAGVTSIGASAFSGFNSLTSVTFEADSQLTSIGQQAFQNCTGLTSITIPASVQTIGQQAFYDCTRLTSVTFAGTIPSASFNSIGSFPGDLRTKFYATDSANGTPGRYTRPNVASNTWTLQQP